MRRIVIPILAFSFTYFAIAFVGTSSASAQVNTTAYVQNYLLQDPAVSPYLNLLRNNGRGYTANYQTLVRPMIQQRQQAQYQQIEINRLQQQIGANEALLNQIRENRTDQSLQTGHPTRFMNTLNYYPGFRANR